MAGSFERIKGAVTDTRAGVAIFATKIEVKRQDAEFAGEQKSVRRSNKQFHLITMPH
jgi:hypothetical protein